MEKLSPGTLIWDFPKRPYWHHARRSFGRRFDYQPELKRIRTKLRHLKQRIEVTKKILKRKVP